MIQSLARGIKEAVLKDDKDKHKDGVAAGAGSAAASTSGVPVLNPAAAIADSRTQKLTVGGVEVEGVSISGQETCIIIPRYKIAFDIGRCPQRACFQQTVLLTHTHLDHVGGLPFHVCTRNMQSLPPSKVVCPPGYAEGIQKFMGAVLELQHNPAVEYEVLEVQPGTDHQLPGGFIARPFATTHSITSQGYVIYSQRKKLREDLAGKSQDEIRQLRLAGEEVTQTIEVPEVAFTGDTTAAFLENSHEGGPIVADALRAKLLIIELTFLDDVAVDEARDKGHMHIADFVAQAHKFQNEAILLVHFSPRYKRTDIIEALNTMLPPALKSKCCPLLNGID